MNNNTGIFRSVSTNSDSRSLESFNTDSSMGIENIDNFDDIYDKHYIQFHELEDFFSFRTLFSKDNLPIVSSGTNNFNLKYKNYSIRIKKDPVYTVNIRNSFSRIPIVIHNSDFYEEINRDEIILRKASSLNIAPKLYKISSIHLGVPLINYFKFLYDNIYKDRSLFANYEEYQRYNRGILELKEYYEKKWHHNNYNNKDCILRIQISESFDCDLYEFYEKKKNTNSFKSKSKIINNMISIDRTSSNNNLIDDEDKIIAKQIVELFRKSIYDMQIICYDIKPLNTVIQKDENGRINVKLIDWDSDWCIDKNNDISHVIEMSKKMGLYETNKNVFLFINCIIMANHFFQYFDYNILYNEIIQFIEKTPTIDISYVKSIFCKDNERRKNFFTMSNHYFKGSQYFQMRILIDDINRWDKRTKLGNTPNKIKENKDKCDEIFEILLKNSTKLTRKHVEYTIPEYGRGKRIKKFNTMLDTIFELENENETPTENTGGNKKKKTRKIKKTNKKSRKNRKTKK